MFGNALFLMLSASNLSCIRGDRTLFNGICFALQSGQWLQIEGENGVGKTSLLRIVCGLLTPDSGEVCWNSRQIRDTGDEYRAQLLYLGHTAAIKDDLTLLENLQLGATFGGQSLTTGDAINALRQLGQKGSENLMARHLSHGQKRRVALARLVLNRATLWILDEPFVALDSEAVRTVCSLLEAHLDGGGMMILTSHQAVAIDRERRILRLGE